MSRTCCPATYPPGDDGLVFPAPNGGPIRWSSWRARYFTPAVALPASARRPIRAQALGRVDHGGLGRIAARGRPSCGAPLGRDDESIRAPVRRARRRDRRGRRSHRPRGRRAGKSRARCAPPARPLGHRIGDGPADRPLTCGFTVGARVSNPRPSPCKGDTNAQVRALSSGSGVPLSTSEYLGVPSACYAGVMRHAFHTLHISRSAIHDAATVAVGIGLRLDASELGEDIHGSSDH